jgi:quinol-cytochrome oxidoreductase complex cytochrome b subunit
MVGVVLLLVTLAYGLTGYLLPWDNRAYWGTVVTTRIAASAPLVGPYLTRLLGVGGGGVGVVTFARFYGMHVLLLPPATILLIALHVYLVRKHGVAPEPGDELVPRKPFFPAQVFKDTVAIFIAFAVLYTLALVARVPLEQLADPTDTAYIPRPEWYFLFLFQTLKMFPGPLEVVGSVVLPGLAVLTLILAPFLDRGGRGDYPQAGTGNRDRLFGSHRLDAPHARRDGRRGLFPPGELRQLSRRGRGRFEARSGPHADFHPPERCLDDPAFQGALGHAAGQRHAAD